MREIKFRLIKNNKIVGYEKWFSGDGDDHPAGWIYSVDGKTWDGLLILHDHKDRFAGLLDKNGKEIYEGDILKVVQRGKIITPMKFNKEPEWTDFYEKIVKVYYEPGMWLTEGSIIGHLVTVNAQARDSGGSIEVIGNIHRNPELFTKNPAK